MRSLHCFPTSCLAAVSPLTAGGIEPVFLPVKGGGVPVSTIRD